MSLLRSLRQDEVLGRVVRSSLHLFSSNSLGLALSVLQGVLAARLLGPAGYGLIAIVMSYASTINSLFSFRMSELVVRYGGEYLEQGEKQKAAALVHLAGLLEAFVSGVAFLFVVFTAGLASRHIAKTPGVEWMFVLYSLGLLANFNAETSTGVLQISNQIHLRGTINLVQSIASFLIVTTAFVLRGNLGAVLSAYLFGKIVLGLGLFVVARRQWQRLLDRGRARAPLSALPSFRELIRFALSSNLSATAILAFRESEVLWVGYFLSSAAAGYYKVAYTIIGLLAVPADPLILTVHPELNRLIVQRAWQRLRDVLRKVTRLSFGYNLALGLGMALFGHWILWLYGEQYTAAYPALMALLVGMVFNYTLFWNRPLLLSLGLPAYPLWATLLAGALKTGLAFLLVPRYGYVMEAALLSLYYLLSVGLIVRRGMRELRAREEQA